jgi:hypothetical protein
VRRLLLALLPLLAAPAADAQIIRGGLRFQEPTAWTSLGVALVQQWSVRDGTTASRWDFGDATQYSASLEKVISGGTTVGLRGTHARVPLRYSSTSSTNTIGAVDADANVSQLFGVLRVSSGREFHSVLELSLGATRYSNFRERGGGKLAPASNDTDLSFAFGYGFGYSLSPTFSIDVVQELATALHQKDGLSAGEGSSVRINSTRLMARWGLGSRR